MIARLAGFALLAALATSCAGRDPKSARRFALEPRECGLRADAFGTIDIIIDEAIAEGRVPGAVVSIGRGGRVVYERAAGVRDPASDPPAPVERDTLFDAASLAKPVATAAVAAVLASEGTIRFDDRVGPAILDDLLFHTSGLPPYVEWRDLEAAGPGVPLHQAIFGLCADRTASRPVGRYFEYSNAGYLAASSWLEERAGQPLGDAAAGRVWGPLGMSRTTFHPGRLAGASVARTSPDVEPGRPFDPLGAWVTARLPGNDPGHSGLFTTAGDLTRFCQAILHPGASGLPGAGAWAEMLAGEPRELGVWEGEGDILVSSRTCRRTRAFAVDDWGRLSHTAYTGCLVELDPSSGISLVIVTNAVHQETDGWRALEAPIRRALERSDTQAQDRRE